MKKSDIHTVLGRDLSDSDLIERYGNYDNGGLSEECWENPAGMADWIRRLSVSYPQDAPDADLLAHRLVRFMQDRVKSAVAGVKREFLFRPWLWFAFRRDFGHWPWQSEPTEREAEESGNGGQ